MHGVAEQLPHPGVKGVDSGITGHNADNNGVVHAVDIFVGTPGNLNETQAQELVKWLAVEGRKGVIDGHPDRLYYMIYRDKIMGDWSGWTTWDGAGYGHYDHIHISTCDLYWGDPAPISALDYDSKAPWGFNGSTINPAGDVTPEPQELFTMGQYENLLKQIGLGHEKSNNIADLLNRSVAADRKYHGQTHAKVNAIREVVDQIAAGQGVTIDRAKVEAAAKAGAAEALAEGLDINLNVNGKATVNGKDS
ncbi:hypothetical protein [Arthrobacter sp. R-11]|uniref:hypothetical protein n=1 Tax=Arthrobacter sp. R-11 TaxID=3404053 RepID=UPI003CF02724